MAKSVNKTIKYGKNKNGRLVKTSMTKTISTNTAKGSNKPAVSSNPTKNQIKMQEALSRERVELAKVAGKQANVANITAQIGASLRQGIGLANKGSTAQRLTTASPEVDQSTNGGLTTSAPSRDEDDGEGSPFAR